MQDLNGMIDAAKYADLVLLLVDGAFGFEMETFEFLNILQVHLHSFARVYLISTRKRYVGCRHAKGRRCSSTMD